MKAKIESRKKERKVRTTWNNVLDWLGWKKSSGGTTKFVDPATLQLETSPRKLVDIMNDFYESKVQKIRKSLPLIGDPLKTFDGGQKTQVFICTSLPGQI